MEINQITNHSHTLPNKVQSPINKASGTTFADVMSSLTRAQETKSEQSVKPSVESEYKMHTNKGDQVIDLEKYLSPKIVPGHNNLLDAPLLLPTEHNVNVLSKYSQEAVQALMQEYNIPAAPSSISFDPEGKLQLPADYPHAAVLRQALAEHPHVERALSTTAAVASHYAGMLEARAFSDEMSVARTQADRDRVAEKYSYLFDPNRPDKEIVLVFLENGDLVLKEKQAQQSLVK